ncbi:MAG: DNA-3-methyladenine glycosylase 2 family protein, partial [Alphaproteobacteria bacterium]|nr:DNA-3-methyladenine glycosylase 2 family protein [Alphaproteobacteria bacterium]
MSRSCVDPAKRSNPPMRVIASEDEIRNAVAELLRREPRFAGIVARHGHPPLRRMEGGLEGLLRIVTDQLISLKAGEAIWRRLKAELGDFDAVRVHRKREASLRRLGLSGAKARCFKAVARAAATGDISFEALTHLSDEEV